MVNNIRNESGLAIVQDNRQLKTVQKKAKRQTKKEGQKMSKFKKAFPILGAAGLVGALSTSAFAAPVLDFSGIGTALTAELTPAITAAMPIAGIILAATIGWKLYKRFAKG